MVQILIGVLCGVGVYFILADAMEIPYVKTSLAALNLTKSQREDTTVVDVWLSGFAEWLSKLIRLNEFSRADLESNLQSAQIGVSPERYVANAIVRALLLGVPLALLGILVRFMFPIAAVVAFVVYKKEMGSVDTQLKEKREEIEYELPRLVFNIQKTLKHSRDVIAMLSTYEIIAGPAMKNELAITLADMRSGNYETAITRLDVRTGSPLMSDVCRGLISVLRGDNTEMYWAMLSAKFNDIQLRQLRNRAKKIPPKVHRLSLLLLFCFLAEYFVTIATYLVTSLATLFG